MRKIGRALAALFAVGFRAAAAYFYLSLPDVRPLRTRNPETHRVHRSPAARGARERAAAARVQRWVRYARISPNLKRAVLVAEDTGFWQHEGIDFEQMKESMEVNIERMEFARGGSTITQQLAKNLYLSPSKNPIRKIREILIARRLEAELTKQRILELYLNVIEWGDGIYGAEAAARTYFGKSAADLGPLNRRCSPARSSIRACLTPGRPTARLRRRQQMIMRRMGAVTPPPVVAETPTRNAARAGTIRHGAIRSPSCPEPGAPTAPAGRKRCRRAPSVPVRPCVRPPCG